MRLGHERCRAANFITLVLPNFKLQRLFSEIVLTTHGLHGKEWENGGRMVRISQRNTSQSPLLYRTEKLPLFSPLGFLVTIATNSLFELRKVCREPVGLDLVRKASEKPSDHDIAFGKLSGC